jgi:hypothetical protein
MATVKEFLDATYQGDHYGDNGLINDDYLKWLRDREERTNSPVFKAYYMAREVASSVNSELMKARFERDKLNRSVLELEEKPAAVNHTTNVLGSVELP